MSPHAFLAAAVAVLWGLESSGWLGGGSAVVLMAMASCSAVFIAGKQQAPPAPATTAQSTPASTAVGAVIAARRSVFPKDFDAKGDVPRGVLEACFEAANWAPNHKARR